MGKGDGEVDAEKVWRPLPSPTCVSVSACACARPLARAGQVVHSSLIAEFVHVLTEVPTHPYQYRWMDG